MSVSAAGTYGTVGAAGGFIRVNGNPMEQPGDKVIPPGSPYPPPGPTGNLHNHVGACSGATANRELQVHFLFAHCSICTIFGANFYASEYGSFLRFFSLTLVLIHSILQLDV